jgi:S1-C subfamily serine protease
MLEQADGAVTIREVVKDSIAERAGARSGDVVKLAAGSAVRQVGDLVAAVQRQAPGTWLPLVVQRAGESVELIAKFPPGQ